MKPADIKNKTILISVLNWGYGHVARSIGLIEQLTVQGNKIILAANQEQQAIFKQYFPSVEFINHDGYPFNFRGKGRFATDLLLSFPKLRKRLWLEISEVEGYCKAHKPDLLISDHRYGFRSKFCTTVFVTHQLQLPVKWYQHSVQSYHASLISRFDHIWVMDYVDSRLAGKLSRADGFENVHYIGPYSRFMRQGSEGIKEDRLLIASGPEIYAQQLVDQYLQPEMKVICSSKIKLPDFATRIADDWKQQDDKIRSAAHIVSRSGYSTIMDAEFLNAEWTFFPTPGQAEQIYLYELRKVVSRK